MSHPFLLFTVLSLLYGMPVVGQNNYPAVHLDYIKSVKFHSTGLELTEPILALNRPGTITLSFDDMTGESINYWYVIEQVNADWTPGQLSEFEWLEGFNNIRVEDFSYSFSPRASYTHYRLQIPNEQISIKKSGNYILRVYEDGNVLAITRRFMVVESQVIVQPITRQAAVTSKARTHQEIDFAVDLKELDVRNPRQEIHATIVQNSYWQGAKQGMLPFFIRDKMLDFDYQDQIVFPAGKEWRFIDTRTLITRTQRMAEIRQSLYQTEVDIIPDETRAYGAYLFDQDINGKFVIQNFDLPQSPQISSDYTTTHFTYIKPAPFEGADLYVLGAFNDFRCTPETRMEYSEATRSYSLSLSLKQGFYNYMYALLPHGASLPDWTDTEGDWYETENDYLILIYYRPLGERYDRIVGAFQFKSFQQ
jgi:hypothetical protein